LQAAENTPAESPRATPVQALLGEAVEWSLLQVVVPVGAPVAVNTTAASSSTATQYALLQPVREFAAEHLSQSQARAVRSRLRRWLSTQATQRLPQDRLALAPDLSHAQALVLATRADQMPQEALELAVAMRGEWNSRASSSELLATMEEALQVLRPELFADPSAPSATEQGAAQVPPLNSSQQLPDEALWVPPSMSPTEAAQARLVSKACFRLAAMHQLGGDLARATQFAELAHRTGADHVTRAQGLALRANLWVHQGHDVDTAQAWLEQAIGHARQGDDPNAIVLVLRQQALVAFNMREDYVKAEPLMAEALQIQQQLSDPLLTAQCQVDIAICWAATGRPAAAAALLETAVQYCRSQEPSTMLVAGLTQLGRTRLVARQPKLAADALFEAVNLGWHNDWQLMFLASLLHLPQAWVELSLHAPDQHPGLAAAAAQLQGFVMHTWQHEYGPLNRVESREVKRSRRLLRLLLSADKAQALMLAGSRMTAPQAVALLALHHVEPHPSARR
jgi:tetratricopeptide (TPR) repeat protein